MSKVEYHICDIEGCDNKVEVTGRQVSVVWITEQNEGRPVEPHLGLETLDICEDCLNEMIVKRRIPTSSGAQGYNEYTIK